MTGPHGLLAELARVEQAGFAVERGRSDALVASVSRAVVPEPGRPLCALTVVGPETEFQEPLLTELCQALLDATTDVARALGVAAGSAAAGPAAISPGAAAPGTEEPR
jgi:DNA-binding IclR family transcriptional regulator